MPEFGVVIVAAVLPLRAKREGDKWHFKWDYSRAGAKLSNPQRNFKCVPPLGSEWREICENGGKFARVVITILIPCPTLSVDTSVGWACKWRRVNRGRFARS